MFIVLVVSLLVLAISLLRTAKVLGASAAQVWRSSDGTSWIQVNIDGFGDYNVHRVSSLTVFGSYLYAGTDYGQLEDFPEIVEDHQTMEVLPYTGTDINLIQALRAP